MKSFSLLKNENTGDIVLINRHRLDYPDHLELGFQEIKEGSKNELHEFVKEYFETNQVADEKQMYLTLQ
jgi:hypothetical protein